MKDAASEKLVCDGIEDFVVLDEDVKWSEPRDCCATGTLVHTKEGLKPIETIQAGDWVLSFPADQPRPNHIRRPEEYSYRQVKRVFVREDQPLCKLIVLNLASGNKETFSVTPNHLIWCKGRGWTPVGAMDSAGDVLENLIFGNLIVYKCRQNVDVGRVYNFEVDEFNTYYVGEEGVWVHS